MQQQYCFWTCRGLLRLGVGRLFMGKAPREGKQIPNAKLNLSTGVGCELAAGLMKQLTNRDFSINFNYDGAIGILVNKTMRDDAVGRS